jgi:hypothetical protein
MQASCQPLGRKKINAVTYLMATAYGLPFHFRRAMTTRNVVAMNIQGCHIDGAEKHASREGLTNRHREPKIG